MLKELLHAGFPAIHINSQEPERAEKTCNCDGYAVYVWDCVRGTRELPNGDVVDENNSPMSIFEFLNGKSNTVLFAHNLPVFFEIIEVTQAIVNALPAWKSSGCCLVSIGPSSQFRPELEKVFHVIDLPLPSADDLMKMQQDLLAGVEDCEIEADLKIASLAKGLTSDEAEMSFALSLVRTGKLSAEVIVESKKQLIKKSGLMEFWPSVDPEMVGGLDQLKKYIQNRTKAFEPGNEHLPKPKGIVLVGIPGTGKSLACKATAAIMNWPLIRLDFSALKASLVGESEANMRRATKIIDAFGSAVIWCDEVEKSVAGVASSGQTDSGTTSSMFGHFLTWMQETTSPVLIMMTANDISMLPPEFLRAGRMDAIFFVDLPSPNEREEIIKIQNKKYGASIPENASLDGWTGAEIEQLAKDSLFDGYDEAVKNIVPLNKSAKEKISSLREWAKNRARIANSKEVKLEIARKVAMKAAWEK
jgi:hypothetical protein